MLTFVFVVAPHKVTLFWVCAIGPSFLPFLQALQNWPFEVKCRMVSDGSWILGTSSKQCFHACNLILGNKKKSGGQIQWVRTLGDLHYVFSSQNSCCCFCLSVSSQRTNFTKIHHMFKSPLRIHWYLQSERPNWLMISEMVLCWSFLTLILLMWRIWWAPNNASKWQMGFNLAFKRLRLCAVSRYLHLCGLWMGTWVLTIINQIFPLHESRNLLKYLYYFHGIVTNSFLSILSIADVIVASWSNTLPKFVVPSLENIRSHLTLHRSEHQLRSSTQVCGCKAHLNDSEDYGM